MVTLSGAAQQPLAALKDRHRVLIVFAPDSADERFRVQLSQLDDKAMAERDLVLIPVLSQWHQKDAALRTSHEPFTRPAEQSALRRTFHVETADFAVILVGKDGGSKLRSRAPLTMNQLNQQIDAMPMRQQEMQSHPRS